MNATGIARYPAADYLVLDIVEVDRSRDGQVRLTLQGPALADFGVCRPASWVRVFIPGPDGDVGRVFNVRGFDRPRRQLQIQVMRRRHGGVRSQWLLDKAQPGDQLYLIGPRGGAEPSLDVDWHVMLGDETAIAAIASRLRRIPQSLPVEVRVEVPLPASAYQEDPRFCWLHRDLAAHAEPSRLWSALQSLSERRGRGEVWMAGESGLVTALEQWCVRHWSHCELQIRAIGYWQMPRADGLPPDPA
ncbi:siderophore-interacting protein [Frateuria aurantia]